MKNRCFILLFMGLFCLWSCQEPEVEPVVFENTNDIDITSPRGTRPDRPLTNWETIAKMPRPAGLPDILPPWVVGSTSTEVPAGIREDYRSANGWEMVYNTFTTIEDPNQKYFVLYNKYSGLLRMYLYISDNQPFIGTDNLSQTLTLQGGAGLSSSLLNFSDQYVVDVNQTSDMASATERSKVKPGSWYAFEHELAYDANLSSQSTSSASLAWDFDATSIANVKLNGTLSGSLVGSVASPGLGFSATLNNNLNFVGKGQIKLSGDKDSNGPLAQLGSALFSGVKKAFEKASQGQVEGILNGIFGKNSSGGKDNIKLKLETDLEVDGTITQSIGLTGLWLQIPGTSNPNPSSATPMYNKAVGVFNISNPPVINRETQLIRQYDQSGQEIQHITHYMYVLDDNSVNLIYNPEVLAIASIQNMRKEVLVTGIPGTVLDPAHENIGGSPHMTGPIVVIPHHTGIVVGTRISFDVVPNDGSPKITIVKTFKSNMTYTTKWYDPNSGPGDDIPIDGPGGGF